ncbi:MAG: asparagine synthetase B [Candidatus Hydrothermota bacterium]|nr:MAG: asparagine synthetase B [Candidatus Hydrothermae bacterium]RKZ00653.1 MAG: asparagine synthetase B [Candidatus Hydrothermae bacterium]
MKKLITLFLIALPFLLQGQDKLLIPMDHTQTDHLKAYGIAYKVLERGIDVEWLLNYRGGSFMMDDYPEIEQLCELKGVRFERVSPAQQAQIYAEIEENNMNNVLLEKAPKVAVYIPPYAEPWDDAVALALEYAEIPYDRIYDEDILKGKLSEYDWLHLHHEDFTGQYGKFYAAYHNADWYKRQVAVNEEIARKLGFKKVTQLKLAVAKRIKEFVRRGGFLFAMCSAPATLDIALAAEGIDIAGTVYDGDPYDPDANSKLDYSRTLAFTDFKLKLNPFEYEHSDIDVTRDAYLRGPNTYFTLFDFSAKFDPVPTILTQNHTSVIKEFLGQDTGFRRSKIKKNVIIMAEVKGTDEVKYLYGNYGKGFFSFLGGHDPEDYQHFVGDPPTDLRLHKNSPGYRLILDNVLFPAAKKQKLKT